MLLLNLNLLATAPGGVARLRELILTLAVQGKLVPQDPKDETASELLKKIRAEKDRLIAEGKIKRDKPLAEIADEEKRFELPQGWEWVRLGTLTNISTGKLDANAAVAGGQYPFFTCSNTPLSIDRFSFDCSAVLLAGNGDFNLKRYVGKFDAYQRTYVIEPILLDLQFLYFTLTKYVGELTKNQRGSAIPYLKLGDITDPLMPLPPLAEQSRIVTRVEELMRLCDALEAKGQLEATQHAQLVSTLLATLTESETPAQLTENWHRIATHFDLLLDRPQAVDALEQTILQLAVRGLLVSQDPQDEPASALLKKIRAEKDKLIADGKIKRDKPLPPIAEDEQLFVLPQGWEWARLDVLSIVIVDCPHSTAKFVSKGLLCIDTNSFKEGVLLPHKLRYVDEATFAERIARLQPEPGDLVFAREGSVGESLIIPEGVVACLGQRVMLFRFSKNVSNEFVRLVVTSKGFLDNLLTLHKGIGAKHVNVGDMRLAIVPLPPLAEQSRIVTRVAQLRRLCFELRQRLSASQSTQAHLAEALVQQVS